MEKGPSPADREPPQAETEAEAETETEDPWKGHAILEKGFKLFY
jgi:hypothetical protein